MNSNLAFRLANNDDVPAIWEIIQFAIQSRKNDGSNQWQDGYPNLEVIENDINNNNGFVLTQDNKIIFYAALIYGKEPEYEAMKQNWLTNNPYAVIHRLAASPKVAKKGFAKIMMNFLEQKVFSDGYKSIRIDTNFDNYPMLKILENRGYVYCGEVYFRGSPRKAFEKILEK